LAPGFGIGATASGIDVDRADAIQQDAAVAVIGGATLELGGCAEERFAEGSRACSGFAGGAGYGGAGSGGTSSAAFAASSSDTWGGVKDAANAGGYGVIDLAANAVPVEGCPLELTVAEEAEADDAESEGNAAGPALELGLERLLALEVARDGLDDAADDGALSTLDLGEAAFTHAFTEAFDATLDVGQATDRVSADGAEVRVNTFTFEPAVPARRDAAATALHVGWIAVNGAGGFAGAAAGGGVEACLGG
jgi:hypothetical protein